MDRNIRLRDDPYVVSAIPSLLEGPTCHWRVALRCDDSRRTSPEARVRGLRIVEKEVAPCSMRDLGALRSPPLRAKGPRSQAVHEMRIPESWLRPKLDGHLQMPTGRSIDAISITSAESSNLGVLKYLLPWKKLVLDNNGNFGLLSRCKQMISIEPIDNTACV